MSNSDYWRHRDDCGLVRSGGLVKIFDGEGYLLFALPDRLSDDDVWASFAVGNIAYREGFERGRLAIQTEIKNLLNINETINFAIETHERREHGISQGE